MSMFFSHSDDDDYITPEAREKRDKEIELRKKSFNDGISAAQLIVTQCSYLNHQQKTFLWDELDKRRWK